MKQSSRIHGILKPRLNPNSSGSIKRGNKPLNSNLPQTELFLNLVNVNAITSRPTIINEDSARDLVRAWGIDKMHDPVIIEPYAGTSIIHSSYTNHTLI
jgi:transcription factor 1